MERAQLIMRGLSSLWKSKKSKALLAVALVILPALFSFFSHPKKTDAALTAACTAAQAVAAASSAAAAAAAISVPTFDSAVFAQTSIINASTASLTMKECILDGILVIIGKTLIKQLSNDIISWIKGGFDGQPKFVGNPGEFFQGVGDAVAGQFIQELGFGFLCEPFKLDLQIALQLEYGAGGTSVNEIGCTLSDVIGNVEGFLDGDFTQGGWDQWLNITQKPNNNKYGAYLNAKASIDARISHAQGIEGMKLGWGNGFFSLTNSLGNILTPGKTIEGQLGDLVGSNLRELELADEINEIVGAFIGQLTSMLLSPGGLASGSGSGYETGTVAASAYADPNSGIDEIQNSFDPYTGSIIDIDPLAGGGGGGGNVTGVNLAVNAPSRQSSTHDDANGFRSSLANDGNTSDGSYAMTQTQTNPWWEVDLGSAQNIWRVEITRRFAGMTPEAALGQFVVLSTNDPSGFPTGMNPLSPPSGVWASPVKTAGLAGSSATETISVPIRGRYVRIQRVEASGERLRLVEVRVVKNEFPTIQTTSVPLDIPVYSNIADFMSQLRSPSMYRISDNEDSASALQVSVDTSAVNTNVPGTYSVFYKVTDSGGAESSSVSKSITVTNENPSFEITSAFAPIVLIPKSTTPFSNWPVIAHDIEDERVGIPVNFTVTITKNGVPVPEIIPSVSNEVFNVSYSITDSNGDRSPTISQSFRVGP